jgi:hypothetical protein
VPKDDADADRWFAKAAAQGEPRAERLLGLAYLAGAGVPQDRAQAIAWLAKAAAHGDADAAAKLKALRG